MKIKTLELTNFRSFEHCEVTFDNFYTAVSGKNNAGKSNLFKAIRLIFGYEDYFDPFYNPEEELNYATVFPQWLFDDSEPPKSPVTIRAVLEVEEGQDEGLFKLMKALYEKETQNLHIITLAIAIIISNKERERYMLSINGIPLSDDVKNNQIIRQLRTPKTFYYHDSTKQMTRLYPQQRISFLPEAAEDAPSLDTARKAYAKAWKKVARKNEAEIMNLLGRLKDKYQVGISILEPDIKAIPFALFLGDKSCSTPIFEWGSGTQNETAILLALLRAQKSSTLGKGGERYSPLILIEEPESFLHPSAQAEFGKVLMDLAVEFNLQMIVSTHSIYMLNNKNPSANLLFERTNRKGSLRESHLVAVNKENWMIPFAQVLGLTNEVFAQWEPLIFNKCECVLLVEGELDKRYFEFFKDSKHGKNQLNPSCQIVPYGGTGCFKHPQILQFVRAQYPKLLISFDFDSKNEIEPILKGLGLKQGKDYIVIGEEQADKRSIEGLLPDWVQGNVYRDNPKIVSVAVTNTPEKKDAQSKLKKLYCDEFTGNAKPNEKDCGCFYSVIQKINRMIG